jgi:hypothetical protein
MRKRHGRDDVGCEVTRSRAGRSSRCRSGARLAGATLAMREPSAQADVRAAIAGRVFDKLVRPIAFAPLPLE